MRFELIALAAFAGFSTAIFHPKIPGVPSCANNAIIDAVKASGCGYTNKKCLCTNSGLRDTLAAEIPQKCAASDVKKLIGMTNDKCAGVEGYPVAVPEGYGKRDEEVMSDEDIAKIDLWQ